MFFLIKIFFYLFLAGVVIVGLEKFNIVSFTAIVDFAETAFQKLLDFLEGI